MSRVSGLRDEMIEVNCELSVQRPHQLTTEVTFILSSSIKCFFFGDVCSLSSNSFRQTHVTVKNNQVASDSGQRKNL